MIKHITSCSFGMLFLIAVVLIGGTLAVWYIKGERATVESNGPFSTMETPVPIFPASGVEFVTSDIELRLVWGSPLTAQQTLAVRAWYGAEDAYEIWLSSIGLDA